MSHHPPTPPETSSPLLWTVAMVVFIAATAWWLRYQYSQGAHHGQQHPLEIKEEVSLEEIPDHEALIASIDDYEKLGKAAWESNCATCHGIDGNPSMANARKFKEEAFKWGADPYSMYVTIKQGNGAMPAQSRMAPEEIYGSIAYIRNKFLKGNNESQLTEINDEYLAAGTWPAPGVVASEGAGPTGDELKNKPLDIPVEGVMAETADAQSDRNVERSLLHKAADSLQQSDRRLSDELASIAANADNGAFVAALVTSLKAGDKDAFALLVSRPGRNQISGGLALLTADEFTKLSQVVKSHQTGN